MRGTIQGEITNQVDLQTQFNTKVDDTVFTGYTANTAVKKIEMKSNTSQNLNTILGTRIQWDEKLREDSDVFSGATGTSQIKILQDGIYNISYSVYPNLRITPLAPYLQPPPSIQPHTHIYLFSTFFPSFPLSQPHIP